MVVVKMYIYFFIVYLIKHFLRGNEDNHLLECPCMNAKTFGHKKPAVPNSAII